MAYLPTFPQPYLNSIDADNDYGNNFSVVINPRDIITGYDIVIDDYSEDRKVLYKYCVTESSVELINNTKYYLYTEDNDGNKTYYSFETENLGQSSISAKRYIIQFDTESVLNDGIDSSEIQCMVKFYSTNNISDYSNPKKFFEENEPVYSWATTIRTIAPAYTSRISVINYVEHEVVYPETIYNETVSLETSEYQYGSDIENTFLTINVPRYNIGTSENILQNGSEYYWTLTLYDIDNNSITTPPYAFTTRTSPEISLAVPASINGCEYKFEADYSQAQNEKFMYYNFSLYLKDVLVATSGDRFGSQIVWKYGNLLPNKDYRLLLTIAMSDKTEYTRDCYFDVEYSSQTAPLPPFLYPENDKTCISVIYDEIIDIDGVLNLGNIESKTYDNISTVVLSKGQTISYSTVNNKASLNIPKDKFTAYFHLRFNDEGFEGKIVELIDGFSEKSYVVWYENHHFYWEMPDGNRGSFYPYAEDVSCIQSNGFTVDDIDNDAIYVLKGDEIISDTSVVVYNDILTKYWWHIILLPNNVNIVKGKLVSETI